ncbi:MAG: hypothetical protein QW562_02465 [Thermosphaera sp.]
MRLAPSLYSMLVLLILISTLTMIVSTGNSETWIVENVSFASSANSPVYPGSKNAKLVIEARYNGAYTANSPFACFQSIPLDLTMINKCSTGYDTENKPVNAVNPGEIVRFVFNVDVSTEAQPGTYQLLMNVSYYISGQGLTSTLLTISIEIHGYPELSLKAETAYLTPYGYPGSSNIGLAARVRNTGPTTILSLYATVLLPDVVTPSTSNLSLVNIQPGETTIIYVQGLSIDPKAQPGIYPVEILLNATLITDDGVRYSSNSTLSLTIEISDAPEIRMDLLDYGLTADAVVAGLNNTGIRLLIQSREPGVTNLIYYKVEVENGSFENGSSTKIGELNAVLNYYDTYSLIIQGLSINDNIDYIVVHIHLHAQITREGASYPASLLIHLYIPVVESRFRVNVVGADWSSFNAYPSSSNNNLIITLVNPHSFSIRDAVATVSLPNVFHPSQASVYNIVINPYSIIEIVVPNISISSTALPGTYTSTLEIRGFLVNRDGSTAYIIITLIFNVTINDPSALNEFRPDVKILNYYWGEGSPSYVYPGHSRAPLTISIQNNGFFTITDAVVSLSPLVNDVALLNPNFYCMNPLGPGDICNAIFYLDLTNSSAGTKEFAVKISYLVNAFNTVTFFESTEHVSLPLSPFPAGEGLVVSESRWLNNNPVYPGSRNAVFYLSIVNLEPYPVYSIWVEVKPPKGINVSKGYDSRVYFAGPIQSLQQISLNVPLDIDEAFIPGTYTGEVTIQYYLQTAGGGVRKVVSNPIEFNVMNFTSAISLISYGWLSGEPYLPYKGARYFVALRNNEFPSMVNPILKVALPPGIVDAATGNNYTIVSSVKLAGGVSVPPELTQLLQYLYGGVPPSPTLQGAATFGKGDILTFLLSINLGELNDDQFTLLGTLEFIDHWGSNFNVEINIPLIIRGSPPMIEVNVTSPLIIFNNGTGFVDVEVNNPSPHTVYEVYLALAPTTGNAIPLGNVKYIPALPGYSKSLVRYNVVYSPVSISLGGGITATPSSAVFMATIIYKDSSGYVRMLNSSLAAMIKPFIDIQVGEETNSRYSSGVLTVNGILYNTGVSQAKSILITLKYGGREVRTLIGDLDPGSQSPFRLEMKNVSLVNETCYLEITYRDMFNVEYYHAVELPITVVQPPQTTPTTPSHVEIPYVAVILIVGLFLIGVFTLIYRFLGKYKITMVER